MPRTVDRMSFLREMFVIGGSLIMASVASMLFASYLDGLKDRKKNRSLVCQKFLEMGIRVDEFDLTRHELAVATMAVVPSSIEVTWKDIGGLDKEIQTLRETIIMPIVNSEIFSGSKLLSFPKGVLLSGPPGCGKTMMAKAIAKESGCIFINVDISVLHDMYVGESPKYVAAIFSLAAKLSAYSPVILFIDEIDILLGQRSTRDHEASQQIKSVFMTNWDGLISSKDTRIVVMGATNLPDVLDAAVYRRLPVRFPLKLPNKAARLHILQVLLKDEDVGSTVDFAQISLATEGMSGSDIKEYCSQSCMVRYREIFREQSLAEPSFSSSSEEHLDMPSVRPVNMSDFIVTSSLFNNDKLSNHFRDGDGDLFLD